MRSSVFRVVGGSLLTFAVVWALVLGWWQSNDHEPSRVDLALYLGALPLALVGGYLVLRGFIEHLKNPVPPQEPATPALADADPLAGQRAQAAAQERVFRLALLDAFVLAPAGQSADDILAAVAAGKRPEPSAEQLDAAGFPVFLAEVKDLDLDGMRDLLAEAGPLGRFADDPAMLRMLSLLDGVMPQARQRVSELHAASGEKMRLHIAWLVPSALDPASFPDLRTWLLNNYFGGFAPGAIDLAILPAGNEADALRQLDEIILRANRDPLGDELVLLLGSASAVDEQTVMQWAGANMLFSATRQGGKIPGEGAVAMLLATRRFVEQQALDEIVEISRASLGRRDKAVDSGGRIGGKLIAELIAGLLDVTQTEAAAIRAVMSDADHRDNRVTEALEGLGDGFAHLDPATDCLAIGTANGALSPLSGLIALACARSKVLAEQYPVLCLSNQDPHARAVLLAMPFVPETRTEPSSN